MAKSAHEPPAAIQQRREYSRQRLAVIAPNPGLQERELVKLAALASAIAGALRQRGLTDRAASLAAEAGIAVFKIAIERWHSVTSQRDLPQLIRELLDELKAVTAGQMTTGLRGRETRAACRLLGRHPGRPIRRRPVRCAGDPGRLEPEARVLLAHARSPGSPPPWHTSVGKAEVAWP